MASEYLLKKYKDVKPDEVRVLTPEEKRRNWWDYHRNHVIIGVILAGCLISILWSALGIGKVQPDMAVAYIGSHPLSPENAEKLTQRFEEICPDMNGDGKIKVALDQYNAVETGDSDALYYAQAAQVKLVADVTNCTSFLFIMEDPGKVQEATTVLSFVDGSLPEDGDLTPDGKYVMLSDCPALADLTADPAFAGLSIARRGFWTKDTVPNLPQCEELWRELVGLGG